MTSLILMYVYFDTEGTIKGITPVIDEKLNENFLFATFPLHEVEKFLTAEANTFNFFIKKTENLNGIKYKITEKKSNIIYTRTKNSYLTKIDTATETDIIIITRRRADKKLYIELTPGFKTFYYQNIDNADYETLIQSINNTNSTLYITAKNNPYCLLQSITFTPAHLLVSDTLCFDCNLDYNDISVYTKKIVDGYGYMNKI